MKKNLLAAVLSCVCAAAFAAPPTDASLEKLMEVQHIDEMWKNMSAAIPDMAKQIIADSGEMKAVLERVPESKKERFAQITEKFLRDTAAETASPAFQGRLKKYVMQEMKATYTQEEVDAMIAFYRTPAGQSVLNKQGDLTKTMMPPMMRLISQRYEQVSQRLTPQFRREVERIRLEAERTEPPRHSGRGKRR